LHGWMSFPMHERMIKVGKPVLDFLFPQYCANCLDPCDRNGLCRACQAAVPMALSPLCPVCGLPFHGPGEDHLCFGCLTKRPRFFRARACSTYGNPEDRDAGLAKVLHRFKYAPDVTLAPALGSFLVDRCPFSGCYDLIVPVPLHLERLRWRGFNQALLLAKPLARHLNIRVDPFVLERIRATPPQVGLAKKDRHRNMAGAFAVRKPSAVRERSALLVDDVYTTGATVNECARTLRRAGARQVDVLVLARAVLQ